MWSYFFSYCSQGFLNLSVSFMTKGPLLLETLPFSENDLYCSGSLFLSRELRLRDGFRDGFFRTVLAEILLEEIIE